jgi:D-3-phosphoglycerate dehydrogenase
MKTVILDDYQDIVRHLDAIRILDGHNVRVYNQTVKGLGQLAARLREAEAVVLIRERTRVTDALLVKLPKLKLISQTGKIGPHLDLEACTRSGVAVAESAGHATATAEFTWLLILAAMRRLPSYMANLYAGEWQRSLPPRAGWPLAPLGEVVAGKILGIWGYGRIGRMVADFGRAFDMKVLVHGREGSLAKAEGDGWRAIPDRREFLAACDIVSLHLRLVEATRGCVSRGDLACMKPTALLVNTSRAELVEPGALVAALGAGRPGLAAIDVYESEPATRAEPLLRVPNAICTPHLGFTERQSYEKLLSGAFENVVAFGRGAPTNIVNPEALATR